MNWLERLKLRWALRGSQPHAFDLTAGTEQHRQQTAAERFHQEHGYSQATAPAEWTEDIAKHNQEVRDEYRAEVQRRQDAYLAGEYLPRFFFPRTDPVSLRQVTTDVNWDLEMTLLPGRRVDVTKETGVPIQPPLSEADYETASQIGRLGREVTAAETDPVRKYLGSREDVLAACGGDAGETDKVEAKARALFGVPS
jgi:hypothetical protein